MENVLNLEEVKLKLFNILEPSGWNRVFKSFMFSPDFDKILISLWEVNQNGKNFTPSLKNVFKAFELCPYNELKAVFVLQDPYPSENVASGIALSCDRLMKLQPSLSNVFKEVNKTVYNGEEVCVNPDLTRWSKQGILLLNTALTTEVNRIGSHYELWKSFTAYLLDWLNSYNPGLVYVYMGKKAESWITFANDNNHKFVISHPASAAYNKSKTWDCKDVFNQTSSILKEKYNFEITW